LRFKTDTLKNVMKAEIIQLPKIADPRGNLTYIEGGIHVPYAIKRVYWIYDVPGGETRGGHAFRQQDEFIVALSGSFDVVVDDGHKEERFHLNRSYQGLHVPHGRWRFMDNFSTNSLAMVIASTFFQQEDYIRSYDDFQKAATAGEKLPAAGVSEALLPGEGAADVHPADDFETEMPPAPGISASESTVHDCKVLDLAVNHRDKGNITVVENRHEVPFRVQRVYYLYDVPGGEERGGHAHKELYQLIIAAGGSFDVELNDGTTTRTVSLNRPYQGLFVVPGIWRELKNFSSGSTCLVLASEHYADADYIRDYAEFTYQKTILK